MLQRVLEPEVMDSAEEAAAYDAMQHGEVNRQFVDDLLEAASWKGRVLDLGTGTAQIPIELCRRARECEVLGIDMSVNMLNLGQSNVEAARLSDRVTLERVDAKQLPYPDQTFSAVISNSIVHHIAQPQVVLAEAIRVTRQGGTLFWRDLLRPTDDSAVNGLVHRYAANENPHQRQLFDDSLRAALSLNEIRAIVAELGFDPMGVHTTSDRHWTWIVRLGE
ncbi:MAG: class I SAM-dependent methyltransferase [Planctomycetales bacterium]